MPLYEYRCPQCGTFEKMQKFSDPVLRECPTCGQGVTKLLSAPAIQFKGTGWYVTDYAGKGKPGDSKDAAAAAGEGTPEKKDSAAKADPAAPTSSAKTGAK